MVEALTDKLLLTGPQRENFPGGTKVDTEAPNLIGLPELYWGPMPLNHFFLMGVELYLKARG